MSNGPCNTASNSMKKKHGKRQCGQRCMVVDKTVFSNQGKHHCVQRSMQHCFKQCVQKWENSSVSKGACNTGSNSMYKNKGNVSVSKGARNTASNSVKKNPKNASVSKGACNTGSNSMYKNKENTIVSNGACNTASSNMNKTVKTPVCPTVNVTLHQKVCTKTRKTQA